MKFNGTDNRVKNNEIKQVYNFRFKQSVSGQEGMSFRNISEASLADDISGKLAFDLFKKINDIETIFIQSNVITINFSRNIGTETELIEDLVKNFFIFYKEEEE